ncbi:MAG: tryptophan--tRNA ligase [Candidatus Wallbacteria bacterium]|nr:tryptophan--tRNA ligase [Candidatus Wallbacteria bacterium]
MKGRILSGMRPTGRLHLGHYFGVLKNWLQLTGDYECFFEIADLHALTENAESKETDISSRELLIDFLASGIDPFRAVVFQQSAVPQHAQLHLLLSMITPVGWLERCPTYKDQINQLDLGPNVTYGLLGYPVLMTTDIILYKADTVPIGKDQLPHLELSREIVRRFNYLFQCSIFPEPAEKLTEVPLLLGLDGRKMSKSYNNYILLCEEETALWEKVRNMVTDPARVKKTDPGHPEVCSVFSYHRLFSPQELPQIEQSCRSAGIGCVQCKKNLFERINAFISPIREKGALLAGDPAQLDRIISDGNAKALSVAESTYSQAVKAMKIGFRA